MQPEPTKDAPGTMTIPLRILHLEHNEPDRGLVRQALVDDETACEFVYASSKAEFAAALEREKFDLILSDFTTLGDDGVAALALVREKCPEVPYLYVSGTVGEERAIESLKNGASDYILKERIERLRPAVRRALREAGERAKGRAAEAALRQAEARFRDIFENSVEGIYQASPDGRLIDLNCAMARICGDESPAEVCARVQNLGRDFYVEPRRRAEFARRLDERGEVLSYESEVKRKDGSTMWISENARAVRDTRDKVLYYESMATDITARRRAEAALRRSEERFREMAASVEEVFWIATPDGERWLYVSPAYEQIWGLTLAELFAHPRQWREAIVSGDQAAAQAAWEQVARGEPFRIEYRIARPDGSVRWIEDRSYPVREPTGKLKHAVGVAVDITQRKSLESQLLHVQKMESIGQLAGGVAHDFNNVLTVILGYSRLLLDGGDMPVDAIEPLTQIFVAGTRATNLTRQLLVFSRKQTAQRRIVDLNRVVDDIVKMLQRLIGEHIALKVELSPAPAVIDADAGMMEQVLMNLAVNARDAMPKGGTLTIATERLCIAEASLAEHPAGRVGEFVSLSVRDTGCGIAPENRAHIFEPFFTTKEEGHGTGLGLATVFGIVQQHQGWIEVESAVGVGTCFRVMLSAAPDGTMVLAGRPAKAPAINGGSETILLVEDEPAVREFAVALLSGHGYRVLQACSAVEALEVWKWHGARIALLFSDLVLPDGLGGMELAVRLRKEKPELKVVLTSGYAPGAMGEEFKPSPGTHFIFKPYKPQELAKTVRDALDGNFNR